MRAYKIVVALFALGLLFGIYFTVKEVTPDKNEEDNSISQKVIECYQTALECKEELSSCSKCYEYCQDEAGEELVNNSLDYCIKGNASAILETAKEEKNQTKENTTTNSS